MMLFAGAGVPRCSLAPCLFLFLAMYSSLIYFFHGCKICENIWSCIRIVTRSASEDVNQVSRICRCRRCTLHVRIEKENNQSPIASWKRREKRFDFYYGPFIVFFSAPRTGLKRGFFFLYAPVTPAYPPAHDFCARHFISRTAKSMSSWPRANVYIGEVSNEKNSSRGEAETIKDVNHISHVCKNWLLSVVL